MSGVGSDSAPKLSQRRGDTPRSGTVALRPQTEGHVDTTLCSALSPPSLAPGPSPALPREPLTAWLIPGSSPQHLLLGSRSGWPPGPHGRALHQHAAERVPRVFVIDGDVSIVLCDSAWLSPKGAQSTKARILQQNLQAK